jgi:hypothetical protein
MLQRHGNRAREQERNTHHIAAPEKIALSCSPPGTAVDSQDVHASVRFCPSARQAVIDLSIRAVLQDRSSDAR